MELVGEHIYTIILCVCVPIQESSFLEDSYLGRTYILDKRQHCRVERTTNEPASGESCVHKYTHTEGYCVYMFTY